MNIIKQFNARNALFVWVHACFLYMCISHLLYWNGCKYCVCICLCVCVYVRIWACARACECEFNVISLTDCPIMPSPVIVLSLRYSTRHYHHIKYTWIQSTHFIRFRFEISLNVWRVSIGPSYFTLRALIFMGNRSDSISHFKCFAITNISINIECVMF